MSLAAVALAGLPPFGLGLFAREAVEPAPRWDFVAVNGMRSDARAQVDVVRAMGATPWLYTTPEHWQPSTWRATLTRFEALARELDVPRIIANPESEWATSPATIAQARAFGAALGALAQTMRVGVVSYPSWPALDEVSAAAGRGVWGSVEIYGRSSQDAEAFASWFARWQAAWGGRVILSIAGWPAAPDGSMGTAEGYAAYLGRLPHAAGAIVWDAAGAMPGYIVDGLERYHPGGSSGGTAAAAGALVATHPPAIVALIVIVALVAALVAGKR